MPAALIEVCIGATTEFTSTSKLIVVRDPIAGLPLDWVRCAERGDGIFETLAVLNGRALDVSAHLNRLRNSAALMHLSKPDVVQWRTAISAANEFASPDRKYALKLVIARSPDLVEPIAWALLSESPDASTIQSTGIRVVTLDRGYSRFAESSPPWLLLGAKTLSYAINAAAVREAKIRGADDAIFTTSEGWIMEGATSTVLALRDGILHTPSSDIGILRGTTQERLSSHLKSRGYSTAYSFMSEQDLRHADAAWLVSSVRMAVPITHINGSPIATDFAKTREFNEFLMKAD